jgi:acyl-CoA hydrolase
VSRVRSLVDGLFPGARVFAPSMAGESALLLAELGARPEAARGVTFVSVQFPGIGRADWLRVHPEARQVAYFMSDAVRAGLREGRAELRGLDYPGIFRDLRDGPPVDVAFAQVSPPGADGACGTGLCNDFLPAVWGRAARRVVHVNPRLPRTRGSFRVRLEDVDAWVEADADVVAYETPPPTPVEERIGAHVARLVRDGDTLQLGIGAVPRAVAAALGGHRGLRVHSGFASDPVKALWDSGALDRDVAIVIGQGLGTAAFRSFVEACDRFELRDVGHTHDVAVVGAIERFVAVNSGIQIDLLGQVNAEAVDGTLHAGAGGLPAFAAGALRSPGGRSLVCLPSTARRGTVSRVVPLLDAGAICSVPRYLADVFVTEHGVAEVRALSLDERARAIIAIAAPDHRAGLEAAWEAMRRKL